MLKILIFRTCISFIGILSLSWEKGWVQGPVLHYLLWVFTDVYIFCIMVIASNMVIAALVKISYRLYWEKMNTFPDDDVLSCIRACGVVYPISFYILKAPIIGFYPPPFVYRFSETPIPIPVLSLVVATYFLIIIFIIFSFAGYWALRMVSMYSQ